MDLTSDELGLLNNVVSEKGKLIFAMVCGSSCYNLNTPTSDRDLFGVYLANEEGPWKKAKEDYNHHDPDYCIYEVSKYAELLCKGNPKLVEPLYTSRLYWSTPEWEALKSIRDISLNKTTLQQYKKYSLQQVHLYEDEKKKNIPDSKKLYHGLRLAMEAERIAENKPPRIWFEGEERDYLMKIRKNEVNPEEVLLKINQHQTKSNQDLLPTFLDTTILADRWLLPLKIASLKKSKTPVFDFPTEDNQNFMKLKAENVLQQNGRLGKILFCAPYGRTAMEGMCSGEVSNSPEDWLAVYAAPTEEIYNTLSPPPQVLVPNLSCSKFDDKYRRGIQVIEVETFLSNVLQGNHVMTESMFSHPDKCWCSPLWIPLLGDPPYSGDGSYGPRYLLNLGHIMHYLGNAEGLLKKNYTNETEKQKYHSMATKFVYQAEKLLNGGIPNLVFEGKTGLPLPEAPEKLLLVISEIRKNIKGTTPPPFKTKNEEAKEFINSWVLSLRKTLYYQKV